MPSTTVRLLAVPAVLAACAFFVSDARSEEQPNPIVAQVKASAKDPSKPFTMLISLKLKEGAGKKLEAAFAPASKATHREKGCLAYDLSRDTKDPTHYVVYERWQSLADLEAHLKAPHTTALLKERGEYVTGAPEIRVLEPAGE